MLLLITHIMFILVRFFFGAAILKGRESLVPRRRKDPRNMSYHLQNVFQNDFVLTIVWFTFKEICSLVGDIAASIEEIAELQAKSQYLQNRFNSVHFNHTLQEKFKYIYLWELCIMVLDIVLYHLICPFYLVSMAGVYKKYLGVQRKIYERQSRPLTWRPISWKPRKLCRAATARKVILS